MTIVYRKSNKFFIDINYIKPEYRRADIINGLYAAIYEEFKGAIHNNKYANLNTLQKLQELNKYAEMWLKQKGFLNEN